MTRRSFFNSKYIIAMLRRWIIRGLALTLLTLCVVAWVGSYWRCVRILYVQSNTELDGLDIDLGRLGIISAKTSFGEWEVPGRTRRWLVSNESSGTTNWKPFDDIARFSVGGFAYLDGDRGNVRFHGVSIPLWFPTVLSGLLLWFIWRKTRAKPKGFPVETTVVAK